MSMLSICSIERKIKETEEQIKGFQTLESSEMAKFQVTELQRRLKELLQRKAELEESQARETLFLRAYGENIETGRISNRTLVALLGGFQTIIDDISNVLVGTNAARGQLKDYAKQIADLEVCGFFAGSFGVKLEKNYQQLELTNQSFKANDVLQEFFGILENSTEGETLIEKISPYGQRTVKKYREWLKEMKDNAVNIELKWINEVSEKRNIDIRYSKVSDIIYTLDSISSMKDEEVIIAGILTGVNIRKNTFELKTDENQIIKGKSRLETLIKISERIGSKIKVRLIKSVSESSVCGTKETWFLVSLIEQSIEK